MREKILHLLRLTGLDSSKEMIVDSFTQQFFDEYSAAFTAPQTVTKIVKEALEQSIDELVDEIVALNEKHFTEADIDALIAHHESPVGKKLVSINQTLQEEMYKMRMDWRNRVMEGIGPEMAKYVLNHSPEPEAETPASG